MERNCSNRSGLYAAIFIGAIAIAAGACSRDGGAEARKKATVGTEIPAATNLADAAVVQPAAPLTPEEREAELMRSLLDDGKTSAALRHARNLMDSDSKHIRSLVLDALSWIGKRALPEITEMINDPNPDIAGEALAAWEQAYSEIDGEHRQAAAMSETLPKLRNQQHVNSILMHVPEMELTVSLPMLSKIIDSCSTNFIGECARDMYTHVTGGEVYESLAVTQLFLEQEKNRKSQGQEDKHENNK